MQTSATASGRVARLSRRYMWMGIVAGLLAPVGLLFQGLLADQGFHPIRLFAVLALSGTVTLALLGRIIGRRNEALLARNQELSVLSAELKELSTIDGLTGIPNRRAFDGRLQAELERSKRYGLTCALVMIDLDRFKLVNDRFGHQAGDQILRRCTSLLGSEKRSGDLVARYGGEEFAAILPHVDAQAALAWAERVRARLSLERIDWNGETLSITASFGVAAVPAHARTAPDLIGAADAALYDAKRRGGNHAVVASVRPSPAPSVADAISTGL